MRLTWSAKAVHRAVSLVTTLAVAVIACGCGIPLDSSAHPLPAAQFVPQPDNSPTTTSTTTVVSNERNYNVYFLQHGVLTAVTRPDPSATTPVTPVVAIAALDNGPNAQELAEGFVSPLSQAPGAQVSVIGGVRNGAITIALNAAFVNLLLGQQLPEAYGQIVLTLAAPAFPQIKTVQFDYDGSALAALLPNGGIKETVSLCDYASIATRAIKSRCLASGG